MTCKHDEKPVKLFNDITKDDIVIVSCELGLQEIISLQIQPKELYYCNKEELLNKIPEVNPNKILLGQPDKELTDFLISNHIETTVYYPVNSVTQ
jgi:hypothetical protein